MLVLNAHLKLKWKKKENIYLPFLCSVTFQMSTLNLKIYKTENMFN